MRFLERPTRTLFFTGKGGVGKTSLSCAAAIRLADRGRRVLLVSTDPASNLDEVLGAALGRSPSSIPGAPGLWALNIDPQAAAAAYRARIVEPFRGVLPAAALASLEEQFSGACTLEIAAFDEFARLLADPAATAGFDHVVFDTAPTGHTLRLLALPSAWTGYLDANTTGMSCLGPLAGLQAQQRLYEEAVRSLSDPAATTLVLVTRPEPSALREADRTRLELAELGVRNQQLVLNGVFAARDPADPLAAALESRGTAALQAIPPALAELPRSVVPLSALGLLGAAALRTWGNAGWDAPEPTPAESPAVEEAALHALADLVDDLAAAGRGVILTMGKGGVGKTTLAAALAVALADRGFPVRLTTTDPAAHVAEAVADDVPGLTVSRIEPERETAAYRREVLSTVGAGLDAAGRALLEEDLRSPCTEEIAVFRAFAREVQAGDEGFVVLDTAPTGHTILLLDSALAYHREAARQAAGIPPEVARLLPRLRDGEFTRVLIVTLPEATPVHEAAALQADLRRAGIQPYAWIVNQSLWPHAPRDPVLAARRQCEAPYLREVVEIHAARAVLVAWQADPPEGLGRLRELTAEPARL